MGGRVLRVNTSDTDNGIGTVLGEAEAVESVVEEAQHVQVAGTLLATVGDDEEPVGRLGAARPGAAPGADA